jgi:formate hydrogenlyase subunit 4
VDALLAGVDFAAFVDLLVGLDFGLWVSVVFSVERFTGVGAVRALLLLLERVTGVAVERCFGFR